MAARINRLPWSLVFAQDIVGSAVTNVAQGAWSLPSVNLFATFRVVVLAFTAGTVQVKLRFGFDETVDIPSTVVGNGIDFAVLGTPAGSSELRSVAYDVAAVAPDVKGNPLSILPPRCRVFITTAGPATLTYALYCACLSAD